MASDRYLLTLILVTHVGKKLSGLRRNSVAPFIIISTCMSEPKLRKLFRQTFW
jgi:hypothetical protein